MSPSQGFVRVDQNAVFSSVSVKKREGEGTENIVISEKNTSKAVSVRSFPSDRRIARLCFPFANTAFL